MQSKQVILNFNLSSHFNDFNDFNNEKRKLITYKNAKYNVEKSLTEFPRNLDNVKNHKVKWL